MRLPEMSGHWLRLAGLRRLQLCVIIGTEAEICTVPACCQLNAFDWL